MVNRYFAQRWLLSSARALMLLLWVAFPATAQESAPEVVDPGTPAAEQPASVLSAADITSRADDVSAKLLETQKLVDADPPEAAEIPEKVDALDGDLDRLLGPIGDDEYLDMPLSEVESLVQTLNRMNRDLDSWHDTLQKRAEQLDGLNQTSKIDEDYFRAILDDDNVDELPDALIERTQAIADRLAEIRKQIRDQLDVRLTSLERISTEKVRIAEALQAIETSAQQREREMFSIDRVPIWKMEASEEPLRSRVSRELRSRLDSVSEYVKTNRNAVIGATALFLLIVGLAVYARPAIVRLGEEGGIYDVERTFIERPVSLALLLGAALIPRFLLPPMPLGLGVIRLLVIVAALLSVVSVISSRKEAGTLAGLLLLTALSGVLEVVQQTDASDRIVLMLVAGLAAYFFASLRRQLRDQPRPDKTLWWRIGYFITAIAPPFLIVCIIAVILGAVAFAQQNVDGTLYLFTLILVIVFVEESLSAAARIFINGPGQNWLRSIRRFPELAHQRLTFLTRLVMLYIFLTALPQLFPQLKVFYDQLIAALTFEVSMGTLNLSVGEVLGLVVGLVLAVLVAKFIRFTLDEDVFPRLPIATGKAAAASRLIYYTLVAGGILFALAAGGIELTKLTLIISALGVGIGFGLQGIVNNFVSGLVLAFERPFQMGDIIATGTLTGRVREIGLRASRIRTFDGAEVIVPNADLIAGNVINWTLSDRTRRLDIRIGVAYGTDPKRVKEILLGVAEDSEVVAKDPEPAALFEGFGDSSLNFTLRAWIPEAGDWPSLSSDLYVAVHDAIVDAGIEIPFPQRTLHIRKGDI